MRQVNDITMGVSTMRTNSLRRISLMDDVIRNQPHHEKRDFVSLASSIRTQARNCFKNEDLDDVNEYLAAPMKIKNEHEKFSAFSTKFQMEEIRMKKEIAKLEKKITLITSRNQTLSQEVKGLQKEETVAREALGLAKKYYTKVWDMEIHIEDSEKDKFTCLVNFKFDSEMNSLKFVIDRNKREVIDWFGSPSITTEEEKELKKKYSDNKYYFPKILTELAFLVLNKIKSS